MGKTRFGILGAADIARRKFLPALSKCADAEFIGVASRGSNDRANSLVSEFGGKVYQGYEDILADDSIDAVYIPLPPSLHAEWIEKALKAGKHVLSEKPFTTSLADTERVISLASDRHLALFENYGFVYSDHIRLMKKLLVDGTIGYLRQIEASFGFPGRAFDDFRHVKALGGGAMLDAGGYAIKAATSFLGSNPVVVASVMRDASEHDVDFWDNVILMDDDKVSALLSVGMDNSYRCQIRLWGSTGEIWADRGFTAPADLAVCVILKNKDGEKVHEARPADQFLLSINKFLSAIQDSSLRVDINREILLQSKLTMDAMKQGTKNPLR